MRLYRTHFSCYTVNKEEWTMSENERNERYIRLAFQYESAMDALLVRGLVDAEATSVASVAKEKFYDTLNEEKLRTAQKIRDDYVIIGLYMRTLAHDGMVSLTEIAKQDSLMNLRAM